MREAAEVEGDDRWRGRRWRRRREKKGSLPCCWERENWSELGFTWLYTPDGVGRREKGLDNNTTATEFRKIKMKYEKKSH